MFTTDNIITSQLTGAQGLLKDRKASKLQVVKSFNLTRAVNGQVRPVLWKYRLGPLDGAALIETSQQTVKLQSFKAFPLRS